MEADPLSKKIEFEPAAPEQKKSLKEKLAVLKAKIFKTPSKRRTVGIIIGLVVFFCFLAIFLVWPLLRLKNSVAKLSTESQGIYASLQTQDLKKAVTQIEATKASLKQVQRDYRQMVWLNVIPLLGGYYRDGQRLITGAQSLLEAGDVATEALQPYADILGLEGEEKKATEEMTAEERLLLALDTLDKIEPHLDEIGAKLSQAQKEITKIKPGRYPVKIGRFKIREKVSMLVETIDSAAKTANEIKPVIGLLRPLLGVPDKKDYLLLFQNDAELRPTGGFMTAYAFLSVHNGQFTAGSSHDIYSLDARFGNRLEAPEPIEKYLPQVYYWHLRDMNLSPDFGESMAVFWENAKKVMPTGEIDGIIAVDTQVLVDILDVLGPIGVSGWGNFSAENDPRCDCPQVFYELELFADKPVGTFRTERKGIIGPLMHSILLNAMGSPRKKWPQFFEVVLNNIQEKHIVFHFFDEETQKTIEAINAGGKIREYEKDYLHINDCNFAGAKSNMFIEQDVLQEIKIAGDGTVTKKLTIDYKNPAPPSDCNLERGELCLNGLYRDWLRVYVPAGSELIEARGSEVEVVTKEELGKTVFEAFYGDEAPLRPLGKAQVVFEYKLPFKVNQGPYRLFIQKQPGTKNHQYQIKIDGQTRTFELNSDRELQLGL